MRSSKAPSQRQLRVGELLRHALAEIFSRGEISDRDLDGLVLTVTEVSMSPDLKAAACFVVPLGGGDAETVLAALKRSRKFIRGQLSRRVSLKFMPDLEFRIDGSFDYSESIDRLLTDPHVRRDLDDGVEG